MVRCATYLVLLLLSAGVSAQVRPRVRAVKPVKPVKPKTPIVTTDLSLGAGFTRSVLFLARNTKNNNDASGITFNATYGGHKPLRACLEYTRYLPIDIAPTWYNIKASSLELNGQALYRSKGNIGFYLLTGLSYNVFKGQFTGINDYLNLRSLYQPGQDVVTRWLGLNAGVGFEYAIRKVIVFGSYKMRVGRSEGYNDVNIQDVCYSVGLRYNFKVPTLARLLKGPRNRYFLNAG